MNVNIFDNRSLVLNDEKPYSQSNGEHTTIDDAKLKEEIVDVLHFFLGMCIDSGMTAVCGTAHRAYLLSFVLP